MCKFTSKVKFKIPNFFFALITVTYRQKYFVHMLLKGKEVN